MVDVRRDDGAAPGDLVAHEFGRNRFLQVGAPRVAGMLLAEFFQGLFERMFSRMAMYSISGVISPRRA